MSIEDELDGIEHSLKIYPKGEAEIQQFIITEIYVKNNIIL